jgi:hypothetical protein
LSFACNSAPEFRALREVVKHTVGTWRFAFFDREPHALFGEEVKTRNTIAFFDRCSSQNDVIICTGPLQKWRGRERSAMFERITFTKIPANIENGIPKLSGHLQRKAFLRLSGEMTLSRFVQAIHRCRLKDTFSADDKTVFVASTAYNFLNVFLRPPNVDNGDTILSENPLHAIKCASRLDANVIFALLSSKLAYWWWHVHGDGFHVNQVTLNSLPCPSSLFNGSFGNLGMTLWEKISLRPIISLNKARKSIAFCASGEKLQETIDETIIKSSDLDSSFASELVRFTHRVVSASSSEENQNPTIEEDAA